MLIGSGYQLQGKIAEGEFSYGHRATHQLLGVDAFVKQARRTDDATVEAFMREAKILATISIPGIPSFREYCLTDPKQRMGVGLLKAPSKIPCIIMELVSTGVTCRKLVSKDTPHDTRATLWILYRTLSILNKLHARYNTAHCDVNPDNILIDTDDGYGSTNIVDLGLAMTLNGSVAKFWNKTDPVPEFEQGLPVTKAVDYYSLGMLARFLLTGGSTHPRIWQAYANDLPHKVRDIVNELTHEDPARRLQDYASTRERLESLGRSLENTHR